MGFASKCVASATVSWALTFVTCAPEVDWRLPWLPVLPLLVSRSQDMAAAVAAFTVAVPAQSLLLEGLRTMTFRLPTAGRWRPMRRPTTPPLKSWSLCRAWARRSRTCRAWRRWPRRSQIALHPSFARPESERRWRYGGPFPTHFWRHQGVGSVLQQGALFKLCLVSFT